MSRFILILFLQVLFLNTSLSQNNELISKIPADPLMMVQVDLNQLNQNMALGQLKEMNMVRGMMSAVFPARTVDDPTGLVNIDDLGIVESGKIYISSFKNDGGYGMAYLIPLNGKSRFENYYETMISNINEEAAPSSFENYNISPWSGKSWVAWNENGLIKFSSDKRWSPQDYEDLSWEEMQSIEEGYALDQLEAFLQGYNDKNPVLRKMASGTGAIQIWGDYGAFMSNFSDMTGGPALGAELGLEAFMKMYQGLYEGMEVLLDINFIPGQAFVNMSMKMPDNYPDVKSLTSGKVNKKFQKYINGDNLLGLYSYAIDPEAYFESTKEVIYQLWDEMPEMMGLGREVGGLLGMLIDEEAIYNFFKGDVVLAFTGVQQFEKIVTTYQYDDEFNAIEELDTTISQLPQFTMMLSYGDEVNMNRLFSIGEKLGAIIPMAKNYYEIPIPTGGTFYIGKYDGILFLSNDVTLMTQKLTSGWGSNSLKKEVWKKIKKNSMYGYWDIPKTLQAADENGLPIGDEMVNRSKESLQNIQIISPRNQSGTYNTTFTFDFVNQQTNALELMMNFIDDAFFSENNKSSL